MLRSMTTMMLALFICACLSDCGMLRRMGKDAGGDTSDKSGTRTTETEERPPAGGKTAPPPPSGAADTVRISSDIGLCTDLLLLAPKRRREMLAMVKPFGSRILRETFRWHAIEPEKGRFNWGPVDGLVDDVEGAGLDILAILMAAPAWAGGSDSRFGASPPKSPADFGRFVEAVVKRYKGRIKYYELWNEPNIPRFWGGRRANPKEFIALLEAGYRAGKRADPDAVFVMGGLTKLVDDRGFIDAVLKSGGLDACDRIGVHLYPKTFDSFLSQMNQLDKDLGAMGVRQKVWVTEVGWASRELDVGRFMERLKRHGISRKQFQESVVLRRAAGWVYEFNPEEAERSRDSAALDRERNELGLNEKELDGIVKDSSEDKAKNQVEKLYSLSAFIDRSARIEKIIWYRFEDRFEGWTKEANFGLVDVQGRPKKSYSLMAGRVPKKQLEKELQID